MTFDDIHSSNTRSYLIIRQEMKNKTALRNKKTNKKIKIIVFRLGLVIAYMTMVGRM